MRVAIIQMNSTVGDIKGNATKLIEQINLAKEQGAQLAVAPELCVPGYPPLDLLERKSFVSACLEEQKRVVDSLPEGLVVVFGGITIRQKETSYGKKTTELCDSSTKMSDFDNCSQIVASYLRCI